jgi:hypothetical protein
MCITLICKKKRNDWAKHKEKRLEESRQNYQQNKEIRKNYQKEYYKVNQQLILEQKKLYAEKNRIKVECQCGSTILKKSLLYHTKSKKHEKYLSELNV